jgi:hypothetical protein
MLEQRPDLEIVVNKLRRGCEFRKLSDEPLEIFSSE